MATRLINRSRVRELALSRAKGRAHRFTRVGESFLERIEQRLVAAVDAEVRQHPSRGRTLK